VEAHASVRGNWETVGADRNQVLATGHALNLIWDNGRNRGRPDLVERS
jgi:hypothetical protein